MGLISSELNPIVKCFPLFLIFTDHSSFDFISAVLIWFSSYTSITCQALILYPEIACLKIFYFVHCREALADIFDRCDLDENGYLSREEFNLFHMKSAGEECDDDAWEVMKGE